MAICPIFLVGQLGWLSVPQGCEFSCAPGANSCLILCVVLVSRWYAVLHASPNCVSWCAIWTAILVWLPLLIVSTFPWGFFWLVLNQITDWLYLTNASWLPRHSTQIAWVIVQFGSVSTPVEGSWFYDSRNQDGTLIVDQYISYQFCRQLDCVLHTTDSILFRPSLLTRTRLRPPLSVFPVLWTLTNPCHDQFLVSFRSSSSISVHFHTFHILVSKPFSAYRTFPCFINHYLFHPSFQTVLPLVRPFFGLHFLIL